MRIFVDANIFALALLSQTEQGHNARSLLDDIVRGKHEAVTSVLVIDEVMWSLAKAGKRGESLGVPIQNIYRTPNLNVEAISAELPLLALGFMNNYNLKPRDAMHCAFMKTRGLTFIASEDRDFDKVKEFKRLKL